MSQRSKVKITVVKTLSTEDVFGKELPEGADPKMDPLCPVHSVGQEFVVPENGSMPQGFCTWAWHDIYPEITTLRLGGNFPWIAGEGLIYSSCSDGLRPVIFKIERTGS